MNQIATTESSLRLLPREKLAQAGSRALADRELIAILLGSGRRGRDVFALAGDVLKAIDESKGELSLVTLCRIGGVGLSKASIILAALEFARRRIRPEGTKIGSAQDVLPLVQHLADRQQEHFICISLNGAHEVITTRIVSVGLVNSTQVHPREVFAGPLVDRASAVIVAHNHPSGSLTPSNEDRAVTRQLREAAKVLGIALLDHIIFSRRGYYSFAESSEGLMEKRLT